MHDKGVSLFAPRAARFGDPRDAVGPETGPSDARRLHELLATLAHELRSPLGALTDGIELVRRCTHRPERLERAASMMARQAHQMAAVVDRLLDAERVLLGKTVLTRDTVDISEVAGSALETLNATFDAAGQHVATSLPQRGAALVHGDTLVLVQVVENLLANASKFTDAGGRIWLNVSTQKSVVRISVRDTGIGMEPHLVRRAFDMLEQGPDRARRGRTGIGLGLALVRELVGLHDGDVEARSDGPGRGSEFLVTLPRWQTDRTPRAEPEPVRPRALPHRRVLVVDDEPDAVAALVELLRLEGQTVRAADDGRAALETARRFEPEVVLLDLVMPEMNGFEACSRLRADLGERVLLVAVTGRPVAPERLRQAGFDAHLPKPTSLSKLRELLAGS